MRAARSFCLFGAVALEVSAQYWPNTTYTDINAPSNSSTSTDDTSGYSSSSYSSSVVSSSTSSSTDGQSSTTAASGMGDAIMAGLGQTTTSSANDASSNAITSSSSTLTTSSAISTNPTTSSVDTSSIIPVSAYSSSTSTFSSNYTSSLPTSLVSYGSISQTSPPNIASYSTGSSDIASQNINTASSTSNTFSVNSSIALSINYTSPPWPTTSSVSSSTIFHNSSISTSANSTDSIQSTSLSNSTSNSYDTSTSFSINYTNPTWPVSTGYLPTSISASYAISSGLSNTLHSISSISTETTLNNQSISTNATLYNQTSSASNFSSYATISTTFLTSTGSAPSSRISLAPPYANVTRWLNSTTSNPISFNSASLNISTASNLTNSSSTKSINACQASLSSWYWMSSAYATAIGFVTADTQYFPFTEYIEYGYVDNVTKIAGVTHAKSNFTATSTTQLINNQSYITVYSTTPPAMLSALSLPEKPDCTIEENDCTSLWKDYGSSMGMDLAGNIMTEVEIDEIRWDYPRCALTSQTTLPCFTRRIRHALPNCGFTASNVQVLFWPEATGNRANDAPISVVTDGITMVSPTVYMSFNELWASTAGAQWLDCPWEPQGSIAQFWLTTIGHTYSSHWLSAVPEELSTYEKAMTEIQTTRFGIKIPPFPPQSTFPDAAITAMLTANASDYYYWASRLYSASFGGRAVPLNVSELTQPGPRAYYLRPKSHEWLLPYMRGCHPEGPHPGCNTIFDDDYAAQLSIPPQLQFLDPAWASCLPALEGVYDPPIALTQVATVDAATTAAGTTSTIAPASPSPTPVSPTVQATTTPSAAAANAPNSGTTATPATATGGSSNSPAGTTSSQAIITINAQVSVDPGVVSTAQAVANTVANTVQSVANALDALTQTTPAVNNPGTTTAQATNNAAASPLNAANGGTQAANTNNGNAATTANGGTTNAAGGNNAGGAGTTTVQAPAGAGTTTNAAENNGNAGTVQTGNGGAAQTNASGGAGQTNANGGTVQTNANGGTAQTNANGGAAQPTTNGAGQTNANGGATQTNGNAAGGQTNANGGATQTNGNVAGGQTNANGAGGQTNANGGTAQTNGNGAAAQTNANGGTVQTNANGVTIQTNANGGTVQTNFNGVTIQTNANGATVQTNANAGTAAATTPNVNGGVAGAVATLTLAASTTSNAGVLPVATTTFLTASISGSNVVVSGQTLTPGAVLTTNGAVISELSNGQGVVISEASSGAPISIPLSNGVYAIGVGTQTTDIPISTSGSALLVGSSTLLPGSTIFYAGKTISLDASGSTAFIAGTPVPLSPYLSATSNLEALVTAAPGGSVVLSEAGKDLVIGSVTLLPGSTVTYAGKTVSLDKTGSTAYINGTPVPLAAIFTSGSMSKTVTIGNVVVSTSGSALVVGGSALMPGGTLSYGGKTMSLDSSGSTLFINGSPTPMSAYFPAKSTSSASDTKTKAGGIGSYVGSGIGAAPNVGAATSLHLDRIVMVTVTSLALCVAIWAV